MSDEAKRIVGQTWEYVTAGDGSYAAVLIDGVEATSEQLRIASCAPEALRLLLKLEWDSEELCQVCGRTTDKERTHYPDCKLLLLLRKAGLR